MNTDNNYLLTVLIRIINWHFEQLPTDRKKINYIKRLKKDIDLIIEHKLNNLN